MSETGFGYVRASDEVLTVRNELAARVVTALRRAGLPAFVAGDRVRGAGLE